MESLDAGALVIKQSVAVGRFGTIGAFAATLVVPGCSDIFGFEEPILARCVLDSDCPSNQLCASVGVCTQCRRNRDCVPFGFGPESRCVDGTCLAPIPPPNESNPEGGAVAVTPPVHDSTPDGAAASTTGRVVDADTSASPCGDTSGDANNCGACGHVCSGAHVAQSSCVASVCQTVQCETGFADCNGGSDGCETNIGSDPNNCGRCPISCDAGLCPSVCNDLPVCIDGACGTSVTVGNYENASANAGYCTLASKASPSAPFFSIFGVRVTIKSSGYLAKLGIVSTFGGANVYLALYHDDGQNRPTRLVGGNQQPLQIAGSPSIDNPQNYEVAVSPAAGTSSLPRIDIDNTVEGDGYWILGTWDASIALQSSAPDAGCTCAAGSCSTLYEVDSFDGGASVFGPLPENAPLGSFTNSVPLSFYAKLAQ